MSKLCYLIQLWGGCESYLVKALQVLQNRAARAITGCNWYTPTRTLLIKCNWLSINQMTFYQSVMLAPKIVMTGAGTENVNRSSIPNKAGNIWWHTLWGSIPLNSV